MKLRVKQEARRGRRHLDRELERRAKEGDDDLPSTTRNTEVSNRWNWD